MNCQKFLRILDERVNGEAPPQGWADHGATCPNCALALRLERTLRAAPSWAERPRMSSAARAAVLKRIQSAGLFWPRVVAMAEESAVRALVAAAVVFVSFAVLPRLWYTTVPEGFKKALSNYAGPLLEGFRGTLVQFQPLLHQNWGLLLLGVTLFMVIFAASLSTRVLRPGRT